MKILVLNCGSSSVKFKLFDMDKKIVLTQGGIEKLGMKDSFLKMTLPNGEKKVFNDFMLDHHVAIALILKILVSKEYGAIKSLDEIDAVGHRVVHGGENFNKSVIITKEVIDGVKACIDMAPLHNPANLEGIYTISKILPKVPQVAVFDTAFHQTMPEYAYMYGIPYELYQKYKVRRYGFHGTSHRYVSKHVCEFLGVEQEGKRIITCHIGNGGSITAIKDGKSIDTSMGFTPLEGLLMGTRSGNVDPGALDFLVEKEQLTSVSLSNLLNKKSGVLGVSGVSSDMRDLDAAAKDGNHRAELALKMYAYRILKYIGAYTAVLGGLDILVFTGGVGENQIEIRAKICSGLKYLGIEIDDNRNQLRGQDAIISSDSSRVKVAVIPTDEEFMIAIDTMELVH
ncbi:MAG TPA: acetate kinase [Candidatus Enterocola sp.]|jgi:acetate kinase|nr:acetate kinase [Candidatus Enterocola sp.]